MDVYVDHSDPDAMPTAEDIADMIAWAHEATKHVALVAG